MLSRCYKEIVIVQHIEKTKQLLPGYSYIDEKVKELCIDKRVKTNLPQDYFRDLFGINVSLRNGHSTTSRLHWTEYLRSW